MISAVISAVISAEIRDKCGDVIWRGRPHYASHIETKSLY